MCLARYARGIDRADAELLKSCYHADAIEEHAGNYEGNAHDYVEEAMPRVMQMGPMQHLLGSSHIDIDGDLAYVETYVWTFVRLQGDSGEVDTLTGGRLVDRFERRDGEWEDCPSLDCVRLESRCAQRGRLVPWIVRLQQEGCTAGVEG